MKLHDFKQRFQERLSPFFPTSEIGSFFELLCASFLKFSRTDIVLKRDHALNSRELAQFEAAASRLEKQEPIQYILGETIFYGLTFEVTPATLIPRPETEDLVTLILEDHQEAVEHHILDIGTGSGCIAIALANSLRGSRVVGVDISEAALEVARNNASINGVAVEFEKLDILTKPHLNRRFDLIVSNPPYVRNSEKRLMHPNVLKYEPAKALFVTDEDPLIYYREILKFAREHLKPLGTIYLEINEYLSKEMLQLLMDSGFTQVELRQDIYGKPRMIKGFYDGSDR